MPGVVLVGPVSVLAALEARAVESDRGQAVRAAPAVVVQAAVANDPSLNGRKVAAIVRRLRHPLKASRRPKIRPTNRRAGNNEFRIQPCATVT